MGTEVANSNHSSTLGAITGNTGDFVTVVCKNANYTGGGTAVCGTDGFFNALKCAACPTNYFDTNGNATDRCEAGCAGVTKGTCSNCTSADASGCTAVTCDTNCFDTNLNATDGCEAGCALVTDGTCTACTSAIASGCTAVTCAANKFDTNLDATDGCENGCPVVTDAMCDTCSDKDTCTSVTCVANYFDINNDATDGCEENLVTATVTIAQILSITGVTAAEVCTDDSKKAIACALAEIFDIVCTKVTITACVDVSAGGVDLEYQVILSAAEAEKKQAGIVEQMTTLQEGESTATTTAALAVVATATGKDVSALSVKGSKPTLTATIAEDSDKVAKDKNGSKRSSMFFLLVGGGGSIVVCIALYIFCCCRNKKRGKGANRQKEQKEQKEKTFTIDIELESNPMMTAVQHDRVF